MKPKWLGIDRRLTWLVLTGWVLACAGYLAYSSALAGPGFPLDDAWIHQAYARNLGAEAVWGFVAGQPSSGSTSPLWTGLIAIGYRLRIEPILWTTALGLLTQLGLMFLAAAWYRRRNPDGVPGAVWIAVLVLLEWHLLWAALSGMEILLFSLLACLVFFLLSKPQSHGIWLGLAIGLGVWIRPDALALALPVAWVLVSQAVDRPNGRIRKAAWIMLGMLVTVLPYLWFNHVVQGSIWPSTFYAKQAEYAVMREQPLLQRLVAQVIQPLTGVGLLLLPAGVWNLWCDIRNRQWARLAPAVWAAALLGVYALRLPVTYQHGRYAMPVLPVILVFGVEGIFELSSRSTGSPVGRVMTRAWTLSIAAVVLAFLPLGARAYGKDVAVIETEMVQTARWISTHTAEDALIAAHDIGALGYFGRRPVLDLAGLISPEVIPILRDEDALADLLDARRAAFLMTFPGWYPDLVQGLEPVYVSSGVISPALGGENMVVYRWRP